MKTRRTLLIAFGTGAIIVPLAAFAQRQAKIPRVAYASGRTGPPDPSRDAIVQGLQELGYVDGKTIHFESHYFGDRMEQIPSGIAEILQRIDVLVVATVPIVAAARQATKTVPMVVLVTYDPVASGLVASLARPGGNITGIARLVRELSGKRLELLKELMPKIARVAVLFEGDEKISVQGYQDYVAAARILKIETLSLEVLVLSPIWGARSRPR